MGDEGELPLVERLQRARVSVRVLARAAGLDRATVTRALDGVRVRATTRLVLEEALGRFERGELDRAGRPRTDAAPDSADVPADGPRPIQFETSLDGGMKLVVSGPVEHADRLRESFMAVAREHSAAWRGQRPEPTSNPLVPELGLYDEPFEIVQRGVLSAGGTQVTQFADPAELEHAAHAPGATVVERVVTVSPWRTQRS